MDSIARISSILENARDLTLDAAQSSRLNPRFARPLDRGQIKKLLDSRSDREVLDGLRRVLEMMYRNQKTMQFFSSIVKNVASPNLEIKKLVYIYTVHHAEQDPDIALLSINTIQKSLSDSNPQVRALALKTMSSIRVPVISQIVSLAIKKGVADMSPFVRRAAALAIPKCYRLDPSQLPSLLDYLSTLLSDKYYVAGAAVMAFLEICPDRIDLIHKHYRALVRKIIDMDDWSQIASIRLLTFYARKCFPRRTRRVQRKAKTAAASNNDLHDFYGEGTAAETAPDSERSAEEEEEELVLDKDLELLLNSIKPLLHSRSSGVILAVTRCYVDVGTPEYVQHAVGPLVSLLRGTTDIQQVAMYNIVVVCLARPQDFVRYASHFLVKASDPVAVWELKIEVLTLIFPHSPAHTKGLILNELEHFSSSTANKILQREAVRAIGRCAQSDAQTAVRCLRLLLGQISSLDGTLASESLTVIRHLIQQDPHGHINTVIRLAKNLDSATEPQARATIIWLVGEFSGIGGEDNIAPDVLRILVKDFANESEEAKRQILLLAAKVYLHHINRKIEENKDKPSAEGQNNNEDEDEDQTEHPLAKLWEYVLSLVRYDTSYDLRDRARMYRSLLGVPQLATLMLLAPKPAPQAPSPSDSRKGLLLGSSTIVLGGVGGIHGIRGYEALPPWVVAGTEPSAALREDEAVPAAVAAATLGYSGSSEKRVMTAAERLSEATRAVAGGSSGASSVNGGSQSGVGEKTLDDWLAESDGEEEEESQEEEDEEEEDEEEDESEEDEEEESEEEDDEEEDMEESSDDDSEQAQLIH